MIYLWRSRLDFAWRDGGRRTTLIKSQCSALDAFSSSLSASLLLLVAVLLLDSGAGSPRWRSGHALGGVC